MEMLGSQKRSRIIPEDLVNINDALGIGNFYGRTLRLLNYCFKGFCRLNILNLITQQHNLNFCHLLKKSGCIYVEI